MLQLCVVCMPSFVFHEVDIAHRGMLRNAFKNHGTQLFTYFSLV